MHDHLVKIESFNPQNEEIFKFFEKEKNEERRRKKQKFEMFYLIYMLAINFLLIFFPFIIGTENFSEIQKISNFVYNSFCILVVSLEFILICSKKKIAKFLDFFRFFLLGKVGLDFFNLIYLTPIIYGRDIYMIFCFMAYLNLILLIFFNPRLYIEKNKFSIMLFFSIYIPISILSCYLFSFDTDKQKVTELVSIELVKILFYLVIVLIHYYKMEKRKTKQDFLSRINNLEELNNFFIENLKSSVSIGFLLLKNSENVFYNQTYFDNFFNQNKNLEIEKIRKSTKFTNSQKFSKMSSLDGITPIPKFSQLDTKLKKQKTHIPQIFNKSDEFKLIGDDIKKFQNFSTKNVRTLKKKKSSLSCKCVSKGSSKISLNNLSREKNDTVDVDMNLIQVNIDVNMKSSQNLRNPTRKNYSSINFRNKKELDKIKEEKSETESEIDCENKNIIKKVKSCQIKEQRLKLITNIKKNLVENSKRNDFHLRLYKISPSSCSDSSDEPFEMSQEDLNEKNIGDSNKNYIEQFHELERGNSNSSERTVVKNSIKLDNNFYQDEFFKNNNNNNNSINRFSFENNYSNKSYTKMEHTNNSPIKRSEVRSSRFNPTRNNHQNSNNHSNNILLTNNIINSQINYNNNYNFNIYNNNIESSANNIHLQIVHNENSDENIPINIKRKKSNKINQRQFKIVDNIEDGGISHSKSHLLEYLFIEDYNGDAVNMFQTECYEMIDFISSEIKKKIGNGILFQKFLLELNNLIRNTNDFSNIYNLGPYALRIQNSKGNEDCMESENLNVGKMYITLSAKMINISCQSRKPNNPDNICIILIKDYPAPSQNMFEFNKRKITDIISQIPGFLKIGKIQQQTPYYSYDNTNNQIIENEYEYPLHSSEIYNKNTTDPQQEQLQNSEPIKLINYSLKDQKTNYKFNSFNQIKLKPDEITTKDHVRIEKASIRFKSKLNKNIVTNNANNNMKRPIKIVDKNKKYSSSSTNSKLNYIFLTKISSLLHDFKHIVLDNTFFFKYLIKHYGIALKMEDMVYIKTMKKYVQFLVKNLTLYFTDQNNFLKGDIRENSKPVDILLLLENLIAVFNRRLEFENANLLNKHELGSTKFRKNIKIYNKVNDRSNPNYQKLISNKNLLMSVFYNLLSNAYKETDEGEIYAETSIDDSKKEIIVKIIDTGKGMPESVKKNWGIPFHKYGEQAGTGLGQFIIETVKNSLNLFIPRPEDNPAGRGTIISVFIPLEDTLNLQNNKIVSNSSTSQLTRKETFNQKFNDEEKKGLEKEITWESGSKCINSVLDENFVENIPIPLPENFNVYNVLVFDDDSFVLRVFQEKVEKDLKFSSMRIKFQFVYVKNFEGFFEEFHKMLSSPKKVFDIFILDQNIGMNMKGVDIADMICKIYDGHNLYDDRFFNFIFMTEESQLLYYYKQSNKSFIQYSEKIFLNGENIFGKSDMKFIKNRIVELIEENQKN